MPGQLQRRRQKLAGLRSEHARKKENHAVFSSATTLREGKGKEKPNTLLKVLATGEGKGVDHRAFCM